ncbi:GNAT family N-acetyltransferase [Curtobacterium flaccumfaciens pv. flaccumfaciens]|uniref:GNAT family N-acetyltransferase n=1 Tax=Curtobacterium flaccumfaciens TaxID=2035 RepID=UPI00399239D5
MGSASHLDWQTAHAGHRFLLQQFVCADPERQTYDRYRRDHHPKPREYEVQSHFRGLRPPPPTGEAVRVGFEDGRLKAVTHFGFDSDGQDFIIWALGVSVDERGRHLGREALEDVLGALTRTKRDESLGCEAFTRIWQGNEPSQQLFAAAGFEKLGPTDKPGLDLWGHPLPTSVPAELQPCP